MFCAKQFSCIQSKFIDADLVFSLSSEEKWLQWKAETFYKCVLNQIAFHGCV